MDIAPARILFPPEDRAAILEQMDEVLEAGALTLGDKGSEFEKLFAEYVGSRYAVAVSSGTSALEIILRSIDVKDRSVVVPANTFFATAAAVKHAGADIIFADVKENLCLDPESLDAVIGKDTKAVIVVHISGLVPPQIEEIRDICLNRGLELIEDAAHAHGSELDGKKAGTFGRAAAFSFYPTKVMTCGEGGMITTDDALVYEKARILRDQGKAGFHTNFHTELGYNWRMSEIHALLGLSQLRRLDQFIAARRRIAAIYDEGLRGLDGIAPIEIPPQAFSNYYKYCALLDKGIDRARVKQALRERFDVPLSGEVYETPCHMQPVFKGIGRPATKGFPVAEDVCARHICLPLHAAMRDEEADYVLTSLKEVLN